jgi:hypothetical protein
MSQGRQGVAESKITLSTDPNWYGAEIGDYKASGPVVNIPANKLVGFEPDSKMRQPKSRTNVKKIVAGLKKGDKLPPLLVRKYKNGYQVLDGHHRFWAYKLLGVKSIPAQIVPDSDIEEKGQQGVAEGKNENIILEQMLYEGFLDSAKQYLGNKINSTAANIKGAIADMTSAAILIKDIIQNPEYLNNVNGQLNKQNMGLIKQMNQLSKGNQIAAKVWNSFKEKITAFISTQGWLGFLSRLGAFGFLKYLVINVNDFISKYKQLQTNFVDTFISTLVSKLDLFSNVLSSISMGGFLDFFDTLQSVKKYFLDILTDIKAKLDIKIKPTGAANQPQAPQPGVAANQPQAPQPGVTEKMSPRSHFAGKWKLGSAAHLKGKMKRPAQQGDLVGDSESKSIPIDENIENLMGKLINKIIINETIQNNK